MLKRKIESGDLVVICGPTATGKTHLAVNLAAQFNGEILSADSRQVYRGMDLGTGKDLDEYTLDDITIPYHLIDIAEPHDVYSLYNYIEDFSEAYNSVVNRGSLPIAAGGTGLYLEAVLKGYRVPNVPENVSLREELMIRNKDDLIAQLKELDADIYSETDLSSVKRIVRAIEVALYGREHKLQYSGENLPVFSPLVCVVHWPRHELIKRIDTRVEERIQSGMVEEVKDLMDKGLSEKRLLDFGMEYKFITRYLLGHSSYEEMLEALKTDIHRLAKRQMTWFRGMQRRGIEVNWIERGDETVAAELLKQYCAE
jgi:tRNA dimethylallyltransferase